MISIRVKNKPSKRAKSDSPIQERKGFFSFSQKVDYGLFLLTQLAGTDKSNPLSLKTVAKENFLSFYFMQKVALDMRKAGLISSERGKNGGYVLMGDPSKIQLLDVLEALEGQFALMHCLRHGLDANHCAREEDCRVRSGFGMLNEIIIGTLSKFTLADFINSKWHQNN